MLLQVGQPESSLLERPAEYGRVGVLEANVLAVQYRGGVFRDKLEGKGDGSDTVGEGPRAWQVGQLEASLLKGTAEDGWVGLLEAYVLRYPGVGGQRLARG
jgi:hypothetical protein